MNYGDTRYPPSSSGQKISAQTGYVMDGIQEAVGELIVALKASSNRLLKMIEKSRNDLKMIHWTVRNSDGQTVHGPWIRVPYTVYSQTEIEIQIKARTLNKCIIHALMKMEKINGKKRQKIIS